MLYTQKINFRLNFLDSCRIIWSRTRPELNFAPVPDPPAKSGTGTKLCHRYRYQALSLVFITKIYLFFYFFYLTLILLRLFQQHYCYNVTDQSQESEGSCKPARIKEVHSKLHSFQASLCTLTATHLTLIYVCTYIRLSVPLGCLIKQAGIIIHTILNMWETPGIEPVTSDLTSVYQISSSTN